MSNHPPATGTRAQSPGRSRRLRNAGTVLALCAAVLAVSAMAPGEAAEKAPGKAAGQRPSLTVETVLPEVRELPMRIGANGNVAAWQEAVIGTEVSGLRLTEVRVNVGDVVRRGMLLAAFSADTVQAELALQRATLAEAEASFAEAKANADRAERKAAKAGPKGEDKPSRRDPMVFQLRKEVDALNAEVADLKALLEGLTAPEAPAPERVEEDTPEGEDEA